MKGICSILENKRLHCLRFSLHSTREIDSPYRTIYRVMHHLDYKREGCSYFINLRNIEFIKYPKHTCTLSWKGNIFLTYSQICIYPSFLYLYIHISVEDVSGWIPRLKKRTRKNTHIPNLYFSIVINACCSYVRQPCYCLFSVAPNLLLGFFKRSC